MSPDPIPLLTIDLSKVNKSQSDSVELDIGNNSDSDSSLEFNALNQKDVASIPEQVSWDSDRDKLTESMTKAAQEVLTRLQILDNLRPSNNSQVFEFKLLQPVEELTDELKNCLTKVYAVDHTIYVMLKMVNVSQILFKLVNRPLDIEGSKEAEDCLQAMQLYLTSALCFLECLFDLETI